MPQVTKESIQKARDMDLLTYLQTFEPYELVQVSPRVYSTKTHDSLKISNGKWCWWSRGIGGRSALDFLIMVRGMTLPEAVIHLKGNTVVSPKKPQNISPSAKDCNNPFVLPKRNDNNDKVIAYLKSRGVHLEIIDYLIKSGRLYEEKKYHNAVFVGFNDKEQPRYALMRGTSGIRFLGEVPGSDKHFSFSINNKVADCLSFENTDVLHVFESAIDLISYSTIELFAGRLPYKDALISLAGVYQQNDDRKITLPVSLSQFLKYHPEIRKIKLHLDNDTAGRCATNSLISTLKDKYEVADEPPEYGKDYNDYLCYIADLPKSKRKEVHER